MNKLDEIIELLKSIDQKLSSKPRKTRVQKIDIDSPVNILWEAYRKAYLGKWTVEPARNAMINGMLANISKRVPQDIAPKLVQFYLDQNDSWYLREMHHIRCLAKDCEMLLTRMRSHLVITNSKALEMEKISTNAAQSKEFLERKYGRR